MPAYATERLAQLAGDLAGRRVLILGIAYRGDVKETAFSGAFAVRDALAQHGAEVVASDPLYSSQELTALGFTDCYFWHDIVVGVGLSTSSSGTAATTYLVPNVPGIVGAALYFQWIQPKTARGAKTR